MSFPRSLSALVLALLAFPASAVAAPSQGSLAAGDRAATTADASQTALAPGRTIRTSRSWTCSRSLRRYGRLPIKVISRMPNPGNGDAIRLVGCRGDGNRRTVDLILDVRGNGRGRGTGFDAVKIGQSSHDITITGHANCGRRHRNASVHQDVVQAMSGRRIIFRRFRSGNPREHRWTCYGAGGGFFVSWVNGRLPSRIICKRCRIATYNQNMRIGRSYRSGARHSIFGFHRSSGIHIDRVARRPINVRNRVIRY